MLQCMVIGNSRCDACCVDGFVLSHTTLLEDVGVHDAAILAGTA